MYMPLKKNVYAPADNLPLMLFMITHSVLKNVLCFSRLQGFASAWHVHRSNRQFLTDTRVSHYYELLSH